jgi:acetyl-CoA acetyltransferase
VSPLDKHVLTIAEIEPEESASGSPFAPIIFGAAGKEYMRKYGTRVEQMAAVAAKNHTHSTCNPYSQFTFPSTVAEVLASPRVAFSLTKLQCCPTSDGSAAVVVASEEFVKKRGLEDRAVRIVGQEMVTDMENSFNEKSAMNVAGFGMSKRAAEKLYRNTGLSSKDFQVMASVRKQIMVWSSAFDGYQVDRYCRWWSCTIASQQMK